MSLYLYESIRDQIRPGDVFAFAGKGLFSRIIQRVTGSLFSHVGVVLGKTVSGHLMLIESTTLDGGTPGVHIRRLRNRVLDYPGAVLWLPLSDDARRRMDPRFFEETLWNYEGAWYNVRAIAEFGVREILKRSLFSAGNGAVICSQLVTLGLQGGGVLPSSIKAEEQSPADVVKFPIYREAVQLVGEPMDLSGFKKAS